MMLMAWKDFMIGVAGGEWLYRLPDSDGVPAHSCDAMHSAQP